MKRMLLRFAALLILVGSASASDRTEFNKMKYGRAYLSVAEEKAGQTQKKAAEHKHVPAQAHTCSHGCC